ncbi:helix-turn-helix domain-containing protein [Qingrenia yutianensis]|uniref:Chromosomal replication initiator DnaA C-terminal domain-containing protein n=1 Tax=Qingrenia yutianensis TaxID=2763676 RepID=A0A926F7D5_9FIRM|nr:helix-turn-helix domain-containing protein [Qingrenia yutianensis]MBC8597168.1 hypothetical protein [Qingrenia yutianensis]
MKFYCLKEELADALNNVSKATNSANNIEILRGIKLEAKEGLTLYATNLEISIKCTIEANVTEPGETVLVEKHFNLKENSLVSSKRSKDVAFARHIAMYIMRELTEMSTPKIGQELGGRDHSTVLNGINKVEEAINTDSSIKNLVNDIIKNIRNR